MNKTLAFLFLMLWGCAAVAGEEKYASLKKDEVNWRYGPGRNSPIKWTYREKGYPVKVLGEYDVWRQVEDIEGEKGWVLQTMLSDKRTVLVQEEGNLTDKPALSGRVIAVVEPGVLGRVVKCPVDSKYCLLSFVHDTKQVKGWFPRGFVWGLTADEEID